MKLSLGKCIGFSDTRRDKEEGHTAIYIESPPEADHLAHGAFLPDLFQI